MIVMNSLNSASRYQYVLPVSQSQKEATPGNATSNSNTAADTVSISIEALVKTEKASKTGVEQYALPSWFMEFSPAVFNLSNGVNARMEEARKYTALHEKLAADGEISSKDLVALKSYVGTMMPANTQQKQLEADYHQNRALYNEYGSIHNRYLQEALTEQGITTQEDWNQKVINTSDENQELRFSIINKMFSDPRAMELMNILGIQKPHV
jgi:hypothetical protein